MVLCMTVNPGWGGQRFLEHSLSKLERLRALIGPEIALEVDGGIDAGDRRKVRCGGRHGVCCGDRGVRRGRSRSSAQVHPIRRGGRPGRKRAIVLYGQPYVNESER